MGENSTLTENIDREKWHFGTDFMDVTFYANIEICLNLSEHGAEVGKGRKAEPAWKEKYSFECF